MDNKYLLHLLSEEPDKLLIMCYQSTRGPTECYRVPSGSKWHLPWVLLVVAWHFIQHCFPSQATRRTLDETLPLLNGSRIALGGMQQTDT